MGNNEYNFECCEGPILVDFFASWCGPCKMIAPIIENIKSKYGESLKVIKIDVDKEPDLAKKYEVMSIPTLLFFSEGKIIARETGFRSENDICNIIDSKLISKQL